MDNDNNMNMTPAADNGVTTDVPTTDVPTTDVPEVPKKNGRKKVVEPEPPVEEMVTIKLPRTKDGPKEVMVRVNGDKYLIKCGVPVEVPASVVEVLEHAEEMAMEAMEYEDSVRSE